MPPAALRAAAPEDIERVRALFLEYAQWLKVDLCFQGFDRELASLPGAYAPPRGRLIVAGAVGEAFGCIALRPLGASERFPTAARSSDSTCSRRIAAKAGDAGSPKR